MTPIDRRLSLLISMNGCLASEGRGTSGGDQVVFKFVQFSGLRPDLLLPSSAASFVPDAGRIFETRRNNSLTLAAILWLYVIRLVEAARHAWRNRVVYDVAISGTPFAIDIIPLWLWKARRKGAIVYHLNPPRRAVSLSTLIRFNLSAFEQWIAMRMLKRTADFLIAGNDLTREELRTLMPGIPIFVLPAGFDASAIDAVPDTPKDPNLACFVGRMVSQKGVLDLVTVMETLSRTKPQLRLVMVGKGHEQHIVAAEIERRGLTNVELTGFLQEREKYALLKRASWFFFPSYEEGWGIALAEALYCECRAICYELPHYRSIFNDYPAYAKVGDVQDFLSVFEKSGAPAPSQKDFLRQYDDETIVRQLTEHLSEVAGQKT